MIRQGYQPVGEHLDSGNPPGAESSLCTDPEVFETLTALCSRLQSAEDRLRKILNHVGTVLNPNGPDLYTAGKGEGFRTCSGIAEQHFTEHPEARRR